MKSTTPFILFLLLLPFRASAADGPIGLSLKQLSQGGLESIPMPPAHPVHGQPRLSGISPDKMILFEVVGNPKDVQLATVLVGISSDSVQTVKNCQILAQFMKNASPGWSNEARWLVQSTRQALMHPDTNIVALHGNRRYELFYSKELSNLMLTVKHK